GSAGVALRSVPRGVPDLHAAQFPAGRDDDRSPRPAPRDDSSQETTGHPARRRSRWRWSIVVFLATSRPALRKVRAIQSRSISQHFIILRLQIALLYS